MTRKNLNFQVDGILLAIAEANGLDISDKNTVLAANSLLFLALQKHHNEIVASATGANRVAPRAPKPTAVPPTVLRAAAEEAAA